MDILFLAAQLPFITILTYEAVTADCAETRHYSAVTVGCILAVSVAFWL